MKCTDLEALICDYIDGVLSGPERSTVELHLAECESCREMVADSRVALEFMSRTADVEVPPALVNKILFEVRTGGSAPVRTSKRTWISRFFEPVLQPKFAMGLAMTMLSFAMLGQFTKIPIRQLKPSDLAPAKVWSTLEDKTWRSWERAKKYYESLRLVYEIRETLSDWNDATDGKAVQKPAAGKDTASPEKQVDKPIQKRSQSDNKSS
jgi:hypothetical protein